MNSEDSYVSAVCQITAADKYTAIRQVIDRCAVFATMVDRTSFTQEVIRREKLQSTGIGHGVAIAHGSVAGLDRVHIALGISGEGLSYESFDNKPVHLLFVIASAPELQTEYLGALAAILRAVHDKRIREGLLAWEHTGEGGQVIDFLAMMESQQFAADRRQ